MKSLIRHSGWTIMMNFVLAISGLVLSLLSARLLGPSGKGAYSLALLIISTTGFLANPGIYSAANYFLSSQRLSLERAMPPILILSGISGLGAFVIAIFVASLIGNDFTELGHTMILLVGYGSGMFSISISMNGVLYGSHRIKSITTWSMVSGVLQTVLLGVLSLEFPPTVNLFIGLYVAILTLDAMAKTILGGWGTWRSLLFQPSDLLPIVKYGTSVYSGRVLMILAQKIDTYLLYIFAGQIALGYYSIAASFAEQLWMFPAAVNLVMMANIASRPDREAAEITISASQLVVTVATLGSLALALLGFWLIPLLYGEEYRPAVWPFIVMLPGIVAVSSYMLLEPYFQSRGKPLIPVKITLGGALCNLLVSLLLIPPFGINGASIAYSLSYLFQMILAYRAFAKGTKFSFWVPSDIRQPVARGSALWRKYITQAKSAIFISD